MTAPPDPMRPATVVYRDPTLEHQIVIGAVFSVQGQPLSVSCNCRVRAGLPPFAVQERWETRGRYSPGDEAAAVYHAHLPAMTA